MGILPKRSCFFMSIVLIRSIILYIVVIFSVRLMGKRQIGELQPSELVITILISNIATLSIEDLSIPLIVGITPVLALVCFEVVTSWLSLKSPCLRKLISGEPKIIISNGKVNRKLMQDLRLDVDDLLTSLRINGIFDLSEVQYAVVETTGVVSVMKKPTLDTPTRSDLEIPSRDSDPPQLIISDGVLIEHTLKHIGMTKTKLNNILGSKHVSIPDVFIMTADRSGKYFIAKKEEKP